MARSRQRRAFAPCYKRAVRPCSTYRRFPAWLAIVAVALHASWPLAAYARPTAPALPLELCTSKIGGAAHAPAPDAPAPDLGHLAHCVFCSAGAERLLGLPSTAADAPAAPAAGPRRSVPGVVSPVSVPSYLPARPRGPPPSA